MSKPIESDSEFVRDLTPRQRSYFLEREAALQVRLQTALRDFAQGLGTVSALNGESQQIVVAEASRVTRNSSKINRRLTVSAETTRAYMRTHYRVASKLGPFTLRVGEQSDPIRELHDLVGVNSSVFISACNPFGIKRSDANNATAMECLRQHLGAKGFKWIDGEGRCEDGSWPAEPSVLALGVSWKRAQELCVEFDQCAVLFMSADTVPHLLYHPEAVLIVEGEAV